MGRPRQYASARERQAAYRQRIATTTLWVDRAPFERTEQAMQTLYQATWRALTQGHPTARALFRATPVETLEATVAWLLQYYAPDTEGEDAHRAPNDVSRGTAPRKKM